MCVDETFLLDELVSQRVHEVEETGRAMRIPPGGCEGVEVRDFGRVDGGGRRGGAVGRWRRRRRSSRGVGVVGGI